MKSRSFWILSSESPRTAPLVALPLTAVHVEDTFWAPRIEVNRTHTLETVHRKLVETGAIQNFAIAAGKAPRNRLRNGAMRNWKRWRTR